MKSIFQTMSLLAIALCVFGQDVLAEKILKLPEPVPLSQIDLGPPPAPGKDDIKITAGIENKSFKDLFYMPLGSSYKFLTPMDVRFNEEGRAYHLVTTLFSKTLDTVLPMKYGEETPADEERIKKNYPYVAEYMLRTKGLPKYDVVYKWQDKEISVGYGWRVNSFSPDSPPAINKDMQYYERIKPFILKAIDDINKVGVVKLKFVEPSEEVASFAPIRIIGFKWKEYRRFSGNALDNVGGGYLHWSQDSWNFEDNVERKIRFTDWDQNQVEGYIVPNADNTIGLSACYIKADMDDKVLQSYVSECLFRSLGFPGLGGNGILRRRLNPDEPTAIDENDFILLKMLYDNVIQAGDDKNVVIDKLYKVHQQKPVNHY